MLTAPSDGLPAITLAQLLVRLPGRMHVEVATELSCGVRWVASSELSDPTPFLLGGELLLTAGIPITPGDAAGTRAYIARLVDAGVAALGFGISPVHAHIPTELIDACADASLPLLRIKSDTPFVAVTRTFAEILELRRVDALRSLADVNKRLLRAALSPRPDQDVLTIAARALSSWAVLVDAGGMLRARSEDAPSPARLDFVLDVLFHGSGPRVAIERDPVSGIEAVAHPVRSLDGASLGALVIGHRPEWGPTEHGVISATVGLLELLARQRTAGSIAPGQLAVALLLAAPAHPSPRTGADTAPVAAGVTGPPHAVEVEALLAESVGLDRAAPLRVVIGIAPAALDPAAADGLSRLLAWRALFDTKLVMLTSDGAVAISRLPIDRAHLGALEGQGWIVIVGRAVDASRLRQAYAEAAGLKSRAVADAASVFVDELEHDVHAFIGLEAGRAFAQGLLRPVLRLPAERSELLLTVLRAWLAHNGNWDASGRQLGLHRNSVRRHVLQAAEELGCDLDNAEVRAEMLIALRYLD